MLAHGYDSSSRLHVLQVSKYSPMPYGSVFLTWQSDSVVNTDVIYGTDPSGVRLPFSASSAPGETYFFGSKKYGNYTSNLIFHATIVDLSPKTSYYYKIGSIANGLFTDLLTFNTVPRIGDRNEFVFGIVADVGQTSVRAELIQA
jgi:hypothetical protein